MNELVFLLHVLVIVACSLFAFKRGKVALTAWIALQGVLTNFFVLKQISLFGAHVTCSDALTIGLFFCLNLLREYYGKEVAKLGLWISFGAMAFFVILAQLHLLYVPSPYDSAHGAYEKLLSPSPRLLGASLLAFFISQQLDLRVFQFFKVKMPKSPFVLRNALSTSLAQFVDTFLFSLLGLAGLVAHLDHIIFVSFALKLLLIGLMTPLTLISKRFVPKEVHE